VWTTRCGPGWWPRRSASWTRAPGVIRGGSFQGARWRGGERSVPAGTVQVTTHTRCGPTRPRLPDGVPHREAASSPDRCPRNETPARTLARWIDERADYAAHCPVSYCAGGQPARRAPPCWPQPRPPQGATAPGACRAPTACRPARPARWRRRCGRSAAASRRRRLWRRCAVGRSRGWTRATTVLPSRHRVTAAARYRPAAADARTSHRLVALNDKDWGTRSIRCGTGHRRYAPGVHAGATAADARTPSWPSGGDPGQGHVLAPPPI